MMSYESFVSFCKSQRIPHLLKETTKYPNLSELPQLYAESNGRLVACYSDVQGGVIFKKPSNRWSKSGRTFIKISI